MEPKMPETKLERINDCLYHETSGKSKIKWGKSPVLLDITLADVKVGLCLSINKPSKTSINKIRFFSRSVGESLIDFQCKVA